MVSRMIFSLRKGNKFYITFNEVSLRYKTGTVIFRSASGETPLEGGLSGISQELIFHSTLLGMWVWK